MALRASKRTKLLCDPKKCPRQPEIHGVVDPFVRIDRVVAAVQNPRDGHDADAHRLSEQGNQQRCDVRELLIHVHPPVSITIEDRARLRQALWKLYRALRARVGECANILRILRKRR